MLCPRRFSSLLRRVLSTRGSCSLLRDACSRQVASAPTERSRGLTASVRCLCLVSGAFEQGGGAGRGQGRHVLRDRALHHAHPGAWPTSEGTCAGFGREQRVLTTTRCVCVSGAGGQPVEAAPQGHGLPQGVCGPQVCRVCPACALGVAPELRGGPDAVTRRQVIQGRRLVPGVPGGGL